ncbi:dihydroceramide fatty acyl 2-hydroxylase FAH2 [Vanessa atalanta]|uniref:dihydroceramide fatty acyl 2-hydroxylase FAH2 n=1 Tax=Vanessa atalanta TaxID=42275 RepID=UPI001FCCFF72|nr:dihydroceramide fatty acyl 2-hydroxylase FAH2 [Vanessa atalanta]
MASKDFPVKFAGETYDLNKFLKDHPGGVNTLERYRGRSIAGVMKTYGHSDSAYHMLSDFKVKSAGDGNLTGGVSENGRIITKPEAECDVDEIAFLEELESRLDWSKPILSQLHKIAPHYQKWVNSAVYRKCRLFSNPMLEYMTFTPWYVVPIFWIPIILYLGLSQYFDYVQCEDCEDRHVTNLQFIWHLVFGFIFWTFLEYSLHRWVFHYDPGSSIRMIQMHFLIHGMHHKVPFDGLRQVFPPIPALVIVITLVALIWPIFTYPLIKAVGSLTGYLIYDMIHYYVHHGSPSDGTYFYAMKRYHSNHHFLNHDKAFGISSKLWDHVFKTIVQVKKLNFALRW